MARARVIGKKVRRIKKPAAQAQEAKPVAFDRAKAFQDAISELRDNADQYMREPDLGSAIRRLLNKVGVPMSERQADSLCNAVGVSGDLKPGDTDALRSAFGRAARNLPQGSPSLTDLMKKVRPK